MCLEKKKLFFTEMSIVDHYTVLSSLYVKGKLQSNIRLPTITTV